MEPVYIFIKKNPTVKNASGNILSKGVTVIDGEKQPIRKYINGQIQFALENSKARPNKEKLMKHAKIVEKASYELISRMNSHDRDYLADNFEEGIGFMINNFENDHTIKFRIS